MENQSRNQNDLFQRLVESAKAIPWSYDLATECFTYIGPQVEELLGYPRKAWYEKNFWPEHIYEEDRDQALNYCMDETKLERDHDFEYRILGSDGRVVWIRDNVKVIVGDAGPVELQGFMFDITERKSVEKAIHTLAKIDASYDLEGFFKTCIKNLASVYNAQYVFIGLVNKEHGRTVKTEAVWAGSGFADNFEYELEGTPCADIIDNKLEIINSDADLKYPEDILLSEMGVKSYFGAPLFDHEGNTIGLVSVMDIEPMYPASWIKPVLAMFSKRISAEYIRHKTMEELENRVEERTLHLVKAKEEALKANNAKSEFLSRMSHELRTPLNAIMGFGQLLQEENINSEQKNSVNEITQASDHLLKLINEVLELAKIESGTISLETEDLDINEIVMESIALVKHNADKRSIIINPPENNEELIIAADRLRMKEVVINLLSNAIKYNNDGGEVNLKLSFPNETHIRLEISDTGTGINEEDRERLFEPFSRLGAEYTAIEGTGIGLTITKRLIEMMGGTIDFSSEAGKGSTFWIDCPVGQGVSHSIKQDVPSIKQPGLLSVSTILYIEDNPANLRLVKKIINPEANVNFLSASNAEEGILIAENYIPDLILMDIDLPGMNGYEALSILRKNPTTSHITVFAVSAAAMPRDIEKGVLAGFNRYITKPIQISELRDAVRNELKYDINKTS